LFLWVHQLPAAVVFVWDCKPIGNNAKCHDLSVERNSVGVVIVDKKLCFQLSSSSKEHPPSFYVSSFLNCVVKQRQQKRVQASREETCLPSELKAKQNSELFL